MPPDPDVRTRDVVAPTLPVTEIVPVFALLTLTFAAVNGPLRVRFPVLPLSTSVKFPPLTANAPTEAIAFAVPARLTVPVTPDVLCNNVDARIVPVATCVTPPPPVAEKSTVAPDNI